MQISMIINLILSVMGLVCIYLLTFTSKKCLLKGVKKAVLPGVIIGGLIALLFSKPITVYDIVANIILGILTGEIIFLFYLIAKKTWVTEKPLVYYDDGSPPKFFITGDKHRNFSYVKRFCRDMNTRRKDILIILGDSGFNYFEDNRDDILKKEMSEINITLFCLHGNKENRPENVGSYGIKNFCGGKVYFEPRYSNILFAIDGEIYTFEGKKYMVVGGAHSVDKMRCLAENKPFWEDEMPSEATKQKVESRLASMKNSVYGMLTHTCPSIICLLRCLCLHIRI